MFLKSWEPKVYGHRFVPGGRIVNKAVAFEAVLTCPGCQHENNASGVTLLRSDTQPVGDVIEVCLDNLADRRDCEKCGTTSVMPAPDKAKVLERATTEVTADWISSEFEKWAVA